MERSDIRCRVQMFSLILYLSFDSSGLTLFSGRLSPCGRKDNPDLHSCSLLWKRKETIFDNPEKFPGTTLKCLACITFPFISLTE